MITLDPHRKIKMAAKFAGIFVVIAGVLSLAAIGIQKMKSKKPSSDQTAPAAVQKSQEEKQQDMTRAINEANKESQTAPVPPNPIEQDKKQQDLQNAINKANLTVPTPLQAEQNQKMQDMLKAINEANKK